MLREGGIRLAQSAFVIWIALTLNFALPRMAPGDPLAYLVGHEVGPASIAMGIFTKEEVATFRKCEDFLWTVRCFLHFYTGRAEELLTF